MKIQMLTDPLFACGAILGFLTIEPGCHPSVSLSDTHAVTGGTSANSRASGGASSTDVHETLSTSGTRTTSSAAASATTGGSAHSTLGAASSAASPIPTSGGSNTGGNTTTGGNTAGGSVSSSGGSSAGSATSTTGSSAGSPAVPSACLQLTEAECRLDQRCAAVLGPNARASECSGDERGFSSCVSGGCRDVTEQCSQPEELDLICPAACPSHQWAISPESGCASCVCVDDIQIEGSMKGWDIASWLEADGWHFSLVPGTNRIKTCEEVKIYSSTIEDGTLYSLALPNLVAVKAALTRLAAGSPDPFVSLCDGGACADIGCVLDRLPAATVDDLKRFAAAVGITLNTN